MRCPPNSRPSMKGSTACTVPPDGWHGQGQHERRAALVASRSRAPRRPGAGARPRPTAPGPGRGCTSRAPSRRGAQAASKPAGGTGAGRVTEHQGVEDGGPGAGGCGARAGRAGRRQRQRDGTVPRSDRRRALDGRARRRRRPPAAPAGRRVPARRPPARLPSSSRRCWWLLAVLQSPGRLTFDTDLGLALDPRAPARTARCTAVERARPASAASATRATASCSRWGRSRRSATSSGCPTGSCSGCGAASSSCVAYEGARRLVRGTLGTPDPGRRGAGRARLGAVAPHAHGRRPVLLRGAAGGPARPGCCSPWSSTSPRPAPRRLAVGPGGARPRRRQRVGHAGGPACPGAVPADPPTGLAAARRGAGVVVGGRRAGLRLVGRARCCCSARTARPSPTGSSRRAPPPTR